MITPILENEQYQLFMQGHVERWTESGTSDHYYDYTDHYHQWAGTGVVVDKSTGQSVQFSFASPPNRWPDPPRGQDLKTLVLQTTQRAIQELALPNHESEIVSFICRRILEKVAKCTSPIKAIIIDNIPLAELINAGIVADGSGQIHLGLSAKARG